ncbi:MAG: alpha-1,2-fucosyltransferase [Lachnospiraceae bacterium]|nr:alpha-1,2-fucosyltransferase [Lachnospiraceae bacterium]
MSKPLYIWGSGLFGETAYFFYKGHEIKGYLDKNPAKWGSRLNGIEIFSPDILRETDDPRVVIAMYDHVDEVKRELYEGYGVRRCQIFSVYQENTDNFKWEETQHFSKNTFVISFTSGLGNQMFQYALYRFLRENGRNAVADTSWYTVLTEPVFSILDVFSSLDMKLCSPSQRSDLIDKAVIDRSMGGSFLLYQEPPVNTVNSLSSYVSVLEYMGGYLKGYFQTYRYANEIRDVLEREFLFPHTEDTGLRYYESFLKENCVVGVHVRRGDYVDGINSWMYKDICTSRYYADAIEYVRERFPKSIICFFSNDIEWTKENLKYDNAVYVEGSGFDAYKDWYDMYLMSRCSHNIIANSTFSWWGAWLNKNEEKLVIAPRKWNNACEFLDVYPEEWIKL